MTEPHKIAAGLTADERRVICAMSEGEFVMLLSHTAADAQVPVAATRKAFAKFRREGLAVYGPLYNEDEYTVQGSGTWLSGLGLVVRAILEQPQ